jgi:hypothetical protein
LETVSGLRVPQFVPSRKASPVPINHHSVAGSESITRIDEITPRFHDDLGFDRAEIPSADDHAIGLDLSLGSNLMRSMSHRFGHFFLVVACMLAAGIAAGACSQPRDLHETPEVRAQPCVNCHAQAFVSAMNPKHVGVFPETCNNCHNTKKWVPATPSSGAGFDHTWFPLLNKHASVACAGCHTKGYQKGDTPSDCVGCHQKDYDGATNPSHMGFPTACATCHNDAGWRPATVAGSNIAAHPWFPLVNKHANVACAACHTKGYKLGDTPTDCVGCHKMNYDNATNPSHMGFPTACASCHNDMGWAPAMATNAAGFNHTWFPLVNKHANVACASCHTKGYKAGDTPTDCVGCHKMNYDAATKPPHAGLPTMCGGCHNDLGWSPSTFAHPWPLTGKHTTTPCVSCHTGTPPRWAGTPTACAGCHAADFQRAVSMFPAHSMYPMTCADCHSTTVWTGASGGTHPEANFPIMTGSHSKGVACADCHIASLGSPVKGANTDCIHCHLGAHQQPAIDTIHTMLNVANYPGPNASSPNFCLSCHPKG